MTSTITLTRLITIYCGIPIFISGTIGNLLNIYCLWHTRYNPCGFLFLASSLSDCLVLLFGLLTRIFQIGFNLDWTNRNRVWCKLRVPISDSLFLISLTLMCLASIDRFLNSCRRVRLRNLSRLPVARWAVILTVIIWFCHSIPLLIYADLTENRRTNATMCEVKSPPRLTTYRAYFGLPFYLGIFPFGILISTGLMTFYNIKHFQVIRQRQLIQRQLTIMMLVQIPIIILSTLPYIICTEYMFITAKIAKSPQKRDIENLIVNIVTLIFYVGFTCQFFVFSISSRSFREQVKNRFFCRKENSSDEVQIQPQSTSGALSAKVATNYST